MSASRSGAGDGASTFTQLKRRDQLVDCAIDAIAELGFPRTSVAEVARRAGVSKGVVTYHFAAKDDLIGAVIAYVLDSMAEYVQPRLYAAEPGKYPEQFIGPCCPSGVRPSGVCFHWLSFCWLAGVCAHAHPTPSPTTTRRSHQPACVSRALRSSTRTSRVKGTRLAALRSSWSSTGQLCP